MKASPNGGMKVGREEILCLFTTVDTFLKGTDEGDQLSARSCPTGCRLATGVHGRRSYGTGLCRSDVPTGPTGCGYDWTPGPGLKGSVSSRPVTGPATGHGRCTGLRFRPTSDGAGGEGDRPAGVGGVP